MLLHCLLVLMNKAFVCKAVSGERGWTLMQGVPSATSGVGSSAVAE